MSDVADGLAVDLAVDPALDPAVDPALDLERLAAEAARDLEDASPEEILRWAAATFGDRFCVLSSMGDAVVASLAAKAKPGVDVVFLDTGYHFAETLGVRDAVAAVYDVNVVSIKPELTVAEQDAAYGKDLFGRDPDACCAIRKVCRCRSRSRITTRGPPASGAMNRRLARTLRSCNGTPAAARSR